MAEYFSTPDDLGPLKSSELIAHEAMRMITDAHAFIVPLIWLATAALVLLVVRHLQISRIGALVSLWFAAKEVELRRRGRGSFLMTPAQHRAQAESLRRDGLDDLAAQHDNLARAIEQRAQSPG